MSVYLDRAARCRALLNNPDADVIVRTVAGRLLRANVERAETVLPIGVPSKSIEGSAGLRPNTGKQAKHASAPDPMEGSRHTVKRGRTKRGPTAQVTAYGLAHVVGSFIGAPDMRTDDDYGSESVPTLAAVLEASGSLKRGARGMSALDVYRLTQRLYGDLIPPLLSTDNQAHHAVVHGDDSDTDDYGIAWHNPSDPYTAMDAQGRTVPDSPITYRTRGYGLTFGLPSECITDRWKVAAWISSKRDRSSADAGRTMARRVRVGPESSLHWSPRQGKHGLPMPTPRADDIATTPRWTALHNGYGAVIAVMLGHAAYRWQYVTACDRVARRFTVNGRTVVTTGPTEGLWLGHVHVTRPEPKNGTTARGKRTRQTVKRRTVDHYDAPDLQALFARLATVNNGERLTWTCPAPTGTRRGTFTRSADGRQSVGTPEGPLVKSVRTADAVERKLTHYCAA
jgi:hypothetical protein